MQEQTQNSGKENNLRPIIGGGQRGIWRRDVAGSRMAYWRQTKKTGGQGATSCDGGVSIRCWWMVQQSHIRRRASELRRWRLPLYSLMCWTVPSLLQLIPFVRSNACWLPDCVTCDYEQDCTAWTHTRNTAMSPITVILSFFTKGRRMKISKVTISSLGMNTECEKKTFMPMYPFRLCLTRYTKWFTGHSLISRDARGVKGHFICIWL